MGPFELRWSHPEPLSPPIGTRPVEAFIPERPQHADGIRIEPPPSLPVASGTMPAAIAAAEPPEEPPAVCARFHGFRVVPWRAFSVREVQPCSGVLVLPMTMQPAWRRRATKDESLEAGMASACNDEPKVVGSPAASSRSLTPIGIPASGPGSPPAAMTWSIAAACRSACSASTATKALTSPSSSSIAFRLCWTSSVAERSPSRTCRASSVTRSVRKSIALD